MVRTGSATVILSLSAALTAALALLWSPAGLAHEGETHAPPKAADIPADEFILNDAMRLIATDFGTLRNQGAQVTDPETQGKIVRAAQNAQRYMRTVKRRWTPDRGFSQYADAFLHEWNEAETAAHAGDPAALGEAIGRIGGACKACHDVYQEN